ncbi:MAG: hypothetical protein V1644_01170 [Candidatus Micrarchaeota archaeon]
MAQKLVFERSITRDWSVIYAEVWHRIYTLEFNKQFNWGYSEVILEGNEKNITVYRQPSEHIDGMRRFILKKINKNPRWMQEQCRIVERQVDYARKIFEAIQEKSLEKYSKEELAKKFAKFINQNVKLGPAFLIMLWFPIQMENHFEKEKYQKYIKQAIETRRKIEKIGPLVDMLSRQVTQLCAKQLKIPIELSKYITFDEAINYLQSDEPIDQTELEKRKQHFLLTNEGITYEQIEQYLKDKFSVNFK